MAIPVDLDKSFVSHPSQPEEDNLQPLAPLLDMLAPEEASQIKEGASTGSKESLEKLALGFVLHALEADINKQREKLNEVTEAQNDIKKFQTLQQWIIAQRGKGLDLREFTVDAPTETLLKEAKANGVVIPEISGNKKISVAGLDTLDRSLSISIEEKNSDVNLKIQMLSRATNELNERVTIIRSLLNRLDTAKRKINSNIK